MKNKNVIHGTRLIVTNAIASAMLLVYGRSAYAGTCVETPAASGNWICSGAAGADATGNMSGAPVTITTTPGFGMNVALGNALQISGSGVTFTDTNASDIFGVNSGIWATNGFSGNLSITTNGTIGGNDTGIRVENSNTNNGSIVINTTGTVTGNGTAGIYARNNFGTSDLLINSTDVIGNQFGIHALSLGYTGAMTINSTGLVSATNSSGIYARSGGTDLTVTTNNVGGGQSGIVAFNYGIGTTNITTNGTITGTDNIGIHVIHLGTDLTVTTADVNGNTDGILTRNYGFGTTTINANGTVTGNANGIFTANNNSTTGMTINTADVLAGEAGIQARNNGYGAIAITSTGLVSGTIGMGIAAINNSYATDIIINAVDVYGGYYGIGIRNYGTGETRITTTGTVAGSSYYAMFAYNSMNSSGLTITAANVTGGQSGIAAINNGYGLLTITTTGTVTGANDTGIFAAGDFGSSGITITTSDVIGGGSGIVVSNLGNGALNITATGTVTGTDDVGIYARNIDTNASDLTITAVDVDGGYLGIYARNNGSHGITSVTSTGNVSGASTGIYARSDVNASVLTITAVDVSAGQDGIVARNDAEHSTTTIITTGTVSGTGNNGINAFSWNPGGHIDVSAVNVSGGIFGIIVTNGAYSTTTVSVSGNIAGGSESGISTITSPDSLSTINLTSTAVVGAISGNAIVNNRGDSVVNVAAGASINGTVRLGNGMDTVNIAGVNAFNGITLLDGGDDVALNDTFVDTLNLNSAWSGNLNGANIINWEFININGGTVGFSNAAITAGQINVNNFGSLNGSNNLNITGDAAVASGSRIIAGNATGTNVMNISGSLFSAGSVQLSGPSGQHVAGDRLTVTGNYIGSGGTLILDTVLGDDASATDRLIVAGNASGSTGIIVNNVGGLGAMTTGDGILLVDVTGSSATNSFTLNNPVVAGAFNYRLYQNGITDPADNDWYLRSSARGITSPAMAVPVIGNTLGLSMLGGLHDRLGEQDDRGVWIRAAGNAGHQAYQSNIGNFNGHTDSNFLQIGTTLHLGENIRWGVFAAKAESTAYLFDSDFAPDIEAGRTRMEGFSAGAYATHYTDAFYWDAVIQQSWLDVTANGGGDRFETNSNNWLASFEFGRAFKLANGNSLQPQVQIIAGKSSTDDASDGTTSFNYNDENMLTGRIGLRWSKAESDVGMKEQLIPYLKANLWRSNADDLRLQIGVSDITTKRGGSWAEIGMGFSITTQNNWSVFMQYDYESGLGDYEMENHTGKIGLRRSW